MWNRLREIIRKEFRQVFREPRMRSMLFIPPLVQLFVFGFAVNLDVDHARLAWMDMDRTPESRELLAGFQGSGRFEVVATPSSEAEVQRLLDGARADMVALRPDMTVAGVWVAGEPVGAVASAPSGPPAPPG